MPKIFKYGLDWTCHPLDIERYCIRKGGKWTANGQTYGMGLFHHFKELETILWDSEYHNRWTDWMLRLLVDERISVFQACKDAGKTRRVSKWVLMDYWCFPHNTLTIMTSTTIRGLEMRVWGDIKSLWKRAHDKFDWLEGCPSDSKHGIFTDNLTENPFDDIKIRDMRVGIIGVPCFPAGSMVDTPNGQLPIENIEVGQEVVNACGTGIVTKLHNSISGKLVRVKLVDGRNIDCTEEHPFFTNRGWIKAVDLKTCDRVLSACETLSIVRKPPRSWIPQQKILLEEMQAFQEGITLQAMWENIPPMESERRRKLLFNRVRRKMGHGKRIGKNYYQALQMVQCVNAGCALQSGFLFGEVPQYAHRDSMLPMRKSVCFDCGTPQSTPFSVLQQEMPNIGWKQKSISKKSKANQRRIYGLETISRINLPSSFKNRTEGQDRKKSLVSDRHCISENKAGRGGGRWDSPTESSQRCETGFDSFGTRVEGVEVLERTGDGRFDESKGGYPVFNLSVSGHPSYSVSGVLVHNCMDSNEKFNGSSLMEFAGIKQERRRLVGDELQFIPSDYLKILDSLDAGDFKAAFCGNAIADNGMALDRVAEPEDGWGSEGEITKTTAWRNKYDGMTLNMVGIDSPNMDPETRNKFAGTLNQESIDRVARRPGGKDSVEWWSQIMGVRKIGVISDRPFTVADVKNNGGFNDVTWVSEPTRGLAIDAGFGGDDCVKTYFEFGEEVQGGMVLAFKEQGVYPVAVSSKETPEDQIAKLAKRDCDTLNIPYENVFIEAGMRATLAVSMGRILSPSINAINFGGQATDRPVANDLFIWDQKTQEKRLKRCNEHYSKFVTELIFNVRDLVVSKQARLFPLKAAEEFQKRKWRYVYGDRYEIETKTEYKERNGGKSPNESDSIMIAVEGAIRLGFVIERVPESQKPPQISVVDIHGNTVNFTIPNSQPKDTKDWLEKEVEEQRRFAKKTELSYDN